jgi:poly(3-hydroxybutyrate) depolymerase
MNGFFGARAATVACLLVSLALAAQAPAPQVPGQPGSPQPGPARPPQLTSEELAKLPQTPGAVGDQQRHYYFAEAKSEQPYRIYVPKNYDGKTKMPLIVALHGAGANQNYFFKASYGMPDLMEKYGFIFVEPFGYHEFGGYGASLMPRVTVPLDPGVAPNPVGARRPQWTPEEAAHVNELSEKDVMNVLSIVEKEYKIDTSRVYLMGHSMGGMGTWYLGQKYADKWAALGVMSGGFGYVDYPLQHLKGIPIIATAGGKDTAMHGPMAQAELARFQAAGLDIRYIEIPDGTHMSNIPASFPQVIDFLATHHR